MLKFFRKIRLKLLDEGNVKRYLIYAVGEILLVVIGILIAFKLDDWNVNRVEREQEKQHLASMWSDLENDIININKAISGNEVLSNGLDTLLGMLADPPSEKERQRLLYLYSVKYTYWYMTVEFSELTLSQLKNTGSFQLIKDKEVAKAILQYDHGIEVCKQEYTEQTIYYHELENTQKKIFDLSLAKEMFEYLAFDYMNMFAAMEKFEKLTKDGEYFVSINPELINKYYGDVLYYQSQLNVIKLLLSKQKKMAESLTLLIDKRYGVNNH